MVKKGRSSGASQETKHLRSATKSKIATNVRREPLPEHRPKKIIYVSSNARSFEAVYNEWFTKNNVFLVFDADFLMEPKPNVVVTKLDDEVYEIDYDKRDGDFDMPSKIPKTRTAATAKTETEIIETTKTETESTRKSVNSKIPTKYASAMPKKSSKKSVHKL